MAGSQRSVLRGGKLWLVMRRLPRQDTRALAVLAVSGQTTWNHQPWDTGGPT